MIWSTSSWQFLDDFHVLKIRQKLSWDAVDHITSKASGALEAARPRYDTVAADWQAKLHPLLGDIPQFDFNAFRPLRLSREEDWSDWLAWLIRASTNGNFTHALFTLPIETNLMKPFVREVRREVQTVDSERRLDIVIEWNCGTHLSTVEVKIGDKQLVKTFDTILKFEKDNPEKTFSHFILLTDDLQTEWEVASAGRTQIKVLYWLDVTLALRRCLWEESEPVVWRVWAWTLVSAIEAEILGLELPSKMISDVRKLQMSLTWFNLLQHH